MLEQIEQLYRSGLSFRIIGSILGKDESTIRYHLWKLPYYRAMVDRVLLSRLAHAQGKRLKNAIWQLRRHRPKLYKRYLLRNAPDLPNPVRFGLEWRADCPKCLKQKAVYARKVKAAWQWSCSVCGAEDG
ncbi:MAG: helix-turn-helix domain-containing protein [Hyphomicrobiales bacterium]|nr:helix-turn-helix domain-containing protein [Hyphomicrobiales bacterium]